MSTNGPKVTKYHKGVKITLQRIGHGWRYRLPSGARGVGLASEDQALDWAKRSIDREQEPRQ